MPPVPEPPVEPEVSEHEVNITYGTRRYRVRGLQKNTSYEVLKVNILVAVGDAVHVDTFDLYSAKHRQAFARLAAAEAGAVYVTARALTSALLSSIRKSGWVTGKAIRPSGRPAKAPC